MKTKEQSTSIAGHDLQFQVEGIIRGGWYIHSITDISTGREPRFLIVKERYNYDIEDTQEELEDFNPEPNIASRWGRPNPEILQESRRVTQHLENLDQLHSDISRDRNGILYADVTQGNSEDLYSGLSNEQLHSQVSRAQELSRKLGEAERTAKSKAMESMYRSENAKSMDSFIDQVVGDKNYSKITPESNSNIATWKPGEKYSDYDDDLYADL